MCAFFKLLRHQINNTQSNSSTVDFIVSINVGFSSRFGHVGNVKDLPIFSNSLHTLRFVFFISYTFMIGYH